MSRASTTVSAVMIAVALATTAAGCSKDIPTPRNAVTTIRRVGVVGQPLDDYGVEVTVLNIAAGDQSPQGFPRFLVTIRSVNHRSAPSENPETEVWCDEGNAGGDWFDTSTWEPNGILPAGQVDEGQAVLSLPAKPGTSRYPVATCTHPRLVVSGTDPANEDAQVEASYPIDPATVQTAINAERAAA